MNRAQEIQRGVDAILHHVDLLVYAPSQFVTAYYACSNKTTGIDIIIPYCIDDEDDESYYPLSRSQYYNHRHIEPVRALHRILKYDANPV